LSEPERAHKWPIAIFFAVFAFYLLTSSREPAWGDAHPMWEVAESLVDRQDIAVKTRWPDDLPNGRDGRVYAIAPIGPALVHVPGVVISHLVHYEVPRYEVLVRPLGAHLGPAALGALACMLFFGLLRELGARVKTASLCTAIVAVATTTWVYARMPYSEVLQLVCFLGLFRFTLRVADDPSRRNALWLGAWAGLLFDAKYVFAVAIVGAFATVAWSLRTRRAELVRVIQWAAVTGGPLLALALAYNWLRWGSITSSGYEHYLGAFFGGSVFDGAWGMLLSPNKSALLYSPPLVLAVFGWPHLIRARPRVGLALATMVVPTFLVYCSYRSWSGDYAWGPRFFVWAVPVLMVGLAGFWDGVAARWSARVRIAVLGSVVAAGIAVQVLGSALYWDHFIRIAIDVKNQWLGNPNRSGSYVAERGRGHCDSCFEDTYEVMWTPAFQPIRGHWWLLQSIVRGDDARSAQADAPWRTYTSLPVDLSVDYPRARIDWWGLVWMKDATRTWKLGLVLLIVFVGTTAFGIFQWIRLHRAAVDG
jgi:hypothetical protein